MLSRASASLLFCMKNCKADDPVFIGPTWRYKIGFVEFGRFLAGSSMGEDGFGLRRIASVALLPAVSADAVGKTIAKLGIIDAIWLSFAFTCRNMAACTKLTITIPIANNRRKNVGMRALVVTIFCNFETGDCFSCCFASFDILGVSMVSSPSKSEFLSGLVYWKSNGDIVEFRRKRQIAAGKTGHSNPSTRG